MTPSSWSYSWNAAKENGGEKIVFAGVDRALEMLNLGSGITNVTLEDSLQLSFILIWTVFFHIDIA